MYGYLPNPVVDKKLREECYASMLYRVDYEANVIYSIFQRYIEHFLWDCFDLSVDWKDFKSTGAEHWSIPVIPVTKK